MAELQALKTEKDETEEAKKMAEEQIDAMRKDHEEKVISYFLLSVCFGSGIMVWQKYCGSC